MAIGHIRRTRRVGGEEDEGSLDGSAALASFLKVLLLTCFFAGTALGCAAQLLSMSNRYLLKFLASSALVLWVWFWVRGRMNGPWRRLFVLALLCAGFAAGWASFFRLGPERDELEKEGDALLTRVEEFRARTGRYPESLQEAGCAPRWNRFGGWRYEPDELWSYRLWTGDYGLDGFVLERLGSWGTWYWDT